jgi:NAD(P)-dependent dehydrogenase (short-subunit alcohol dehydrogenase family)
VSATEASRSKTVLVTGAGWGIGTQIARLLAGKGCAVAVNDLDPERARTAASELVAAGSRAIEAPFDVTDYDAVRAGVKAIEAQLGPIDILVNNAGMPIVDFDWDVPFLDSRPEHWPAFVDLNLYGSLNCIHSLLPGMCQRGWGRIIQMSSGAAARGLPLPAGHSMLAAGKAAIEGALRHIALEVAQRGVTVNTVALGQFVTASEHASPEVIATVRGRVPMGRPGEIREASSAVGWLIDDDAGYVTGQVIHVNGGSYQGR